MLLLKLLRAIKGLTARGLALRLAIDPSRWYRIEAGELPLPPALLERLATELTLSSDELRRHLSRERPLAVQAQAVTEPDGDRPGARDRDRPTQPTDRLTRPQARED